jgi:hypothetical protein
MRRSRELLFNQDTQRLELLLTPLNRLDVTIEDSHFAEAIRLAKSDLKRLKINRLEPYYYLSTGYGTVAGTTSIALGFYDCNELLRGLNKELRGFLYSYDEVTDIVRHELGHAFSYAYKLYTRKDFRSVFKVKGNYFRTYPLTDRYIERANPWSRDFVNPSGDHYAQKHPDDDFAETFGVILQPDYDWEYEYRNYPGALKKLRFTRKLVEELGSETPLINQAPNDYEPLSYYKMTVAKFFRLTSTRTHRKKATGYIDPDLLDLFWQPAPMLRNGRSRERDYVHADNFIRKHKRDIITQVSRWTGVVDLVVKDLLDKCSARSHALDLWVRKDKREAKLVEFTSFISYRCALYALNENYMNGRR